VGSTPDVGPYPGQWFRSYGNEVWEFDDDGLMRRREASVNVLDVDF